MKAERIIFLPFLLLMLTPFCPAQGKVAVIDTGIFSDSRKGVTRLARAIEGVDREFQPRQAELLEIYEHLQKQLDKFSFAGPIPTDPEPMTPRRRAEIKAEAEELRRLGEQKEREAERAYSRRIKEVTAPIREGIRRSLEAFVRARGITVLLESSRVSCLVGCDEESVAGIDITQEFIAEYNRLNP